MRSVGHRSIDIMRVRTEAHTECTVVSMLCCLDRITYVFEFIEHGAARLHPRFLHCSRLYFSERTAVSTLNYLVNFSISGDAMFTVAARRSVR